MWRYFYIQSFQDLIRSPQGSPVCLVVCPPQPFLSTLSLYQANFDETWTKMSYQNVKKVFLLDLENLAPMTSWSPFCIFSMRHSHGPSYAAASIIFKIAEKVESCLPLFANENQLDLLVTSANVTDHVYENWIFKISFKKKVFLYKRSAFSFKTIELRIVWSTFT